MDEKLKERLVGAAVVVVLGVVFIPALLNGPPDAGTATRALSLPGQDAVAVKRVTIDLGNPGATAPQPDPMAVATRPPPMQTPATGEGAKAGKTEKPAPKPDQQAGSGVTPTPTATLEVHEWVVQVGSFSSQDNAQRLASQLKAQGFKAFVSKYRDGNNTLHRVRVGPVQAREEAESLAEQLRDGGQKVKVVPNT
ncbi:MAG: SPOR domain-containing protein [Gammaproteobacteria bacterium]|nr:SPOR domain-containing protein [Gammaproteobacteria bacterium]